MGNAVSDISEHIWVTTLRSLKSNGLDNDRYDYARSNLQKWCVGVHKVPRIMDIPVYKVNKARYFDDSRHGTVVFHFNRVLKCTITVLRRETEYEFQGDTCELFFGSAFIQYNGGDPYDCGMIGVLVKRLRIVTEDSQEAAF